MAARITASGNTTVERDTKYPRSGNGHEEFIIGGLPPELLQALFGQKQKTMISDDDIQRHDGTAILLPREMDLELAAETINLKIEEQKQKTSFSKVFEYRPEDGANATATILSRRYGIVVGVQTGGDQGPFGPPPQPPQYRNIKTSHNTTRDVPWGGIAIPKLKGATLVIGAAKGALGPLFAIEVTAPKKHKAEIEELFAEIEQELQTNSIYRGHALQGAHQLTFLDTSGFDPSQIMFSDDTTATLDAALWSVIRHPAAVLKAGMKLRRAVMLCGEWGTGKSSVGQIAAQECEQHGWTFLSAHAGRDNLSEVLQTAALYQRCVVFIEDIDTHIPSGDRDAMSALLDDFDGIAVKDREILLIATTNHPEKVPPGMLRPRRIDYVIALAGLDRPGVERLLRAAIPTSHLASDVDFDAVWAECTDYLPAWVRAVADRALSFAIARTSGASYRLTTKDLVAAAKSLQPQLELMRAAREGDPVTPLQSALEATVAKAMGNVELYDPDYGPKADAIYGLRVKD